MAVWRVLFCCVALCCLGSGCRHAVKLLGKIKVRPPAKLPIKAPAKVLPATRAIPKPAAASRFVANPAVVRTVSQRVPAALRASSALGASLQARSARIPAHVFAQLWSQWQRNHAELSSLDRQLSDPGISTDRRSRLESQVLSLEQKNAEIERLAAQWG